MVVGVLTSLCSKFPGKNATESLIRKVDSKTDPSARHFRVFEGGHNGVRPMSGNLWGGFQATRIWISWDVIDSSFVHIYYGMSLNIYM